MNTAPTPASGHGLADPGFSAALLEETDRDRRCCLLAEAVRTFLTTAGTLDADAGMDTPATLESLAAVELNAVLDARFGVELGLSMLRHPVSARELAETALDLMEKAPRTEQRQRLVPDAAGRFEPFALTDLQQAYLLGRGGFFALGDVPAAFYAEIEADALDVPALETAWDGVVSRHGMLRTVFTDDGLQRVLEEVPGYRFAVHDLRALEEEERRGRLEGLRTEISGRVREPGEWPLFEVAVSKVDNERCVLHVAIDLLIADAPSIRRIVGEWLFLVAGRPLEPVPEVSFRDYVRALEGVEDSAVYAAAREYWLERLPELPAAPELPLRVAAESVTSARFSSRSFGLGAEQWARLRQAALRQGLTPSMVLCWAYAATLRAWSATDAFTLNVTVNDRLPVHPDIDRVVGEFTSQVLVAVDADADEPVCDQITALQGRFWEGFEHRAFSGVQVLRELARSGDGTRTTMPYVFDAVLGQDLDDENTPAWFRGLAHVSATAPQVAIECQVFELGGGLRVQWAVVEELFPDGLVDAAFGAFRGLVERLADDEGLWDSAALGLVPAADLIARGEANATAAAVPGMLLHELGGFLAERGDAPAVIAAGRTLSYGECDRLASRVGRRLRELGACPNALVGVVMDKGWEQPVAALGVLYSGAAYLPVDAGWPEERVRRILERGGCRIVLTQSHLVEKTEWPEGVTVLAVDDPQVWAGVDDGRLEAVVGAEDLAYVIFTSGSTGEPKGVMIDHRGAANTVADINDRFGVGACDRVLGLSSLSFDLSVWDIFGMFAAGGAVVLPGPDAHRDPAVWLGAVREHGVSVWNSVPALMEMFTDYAAAGGEVVEGLRLVLLSGDWIPLSLPGRIESVASQAGVISLGGATEASIWSIHYPIGEVDPGWRSIPYGRPLANQSFAVLDARLEPAPIWVPGELFIGGVGVACGYWGDAERTAERFIDHPVSGERLYRTGDLGRYLPDGSIEFLGRNDHQVKINGYRIELGEIEAHLNAHPAVKDAIVTATHNQLTAYLTPNSHTTDSQKDDARVAEWRHVFDGMRAEIGAVGDAFDTTGWASTYTGRPIPDAAMRLWVEETVDRILECAPDHVVEIGCGTGLLATRLAPRTRYTGIDVSAETLKTLQTYFDARPQQAEHVQLRHSEARDLSGIEDSSVDCVVINSVIQYFPSGDYLLEVLEEAARVLAPGGTLFVGDVRDLRLLHAFHTSVEMHQAGPADSIDDVAERIAQRSLHERELAVAPDLFVELGGLGFSSVSLRPKTGDPSTEMADYRYDAILRKAPAAPRREPDGRAVLEAADKVLDDLPATLREAADSGLATLVLRGVRNPRIASDLRAAEVIDAGAASTCDEVATVSRTEGVRPDDVRALASDAGWRLEACLTEAPEQADLVLRRAAGIPDRLDRECTDRADLHSSVAKLVNRPAAPRHTTELVASVRQHLTTVLPGYMLPRHYLVLDHFPLSANGKVDRGRLPSPELQADEAVADDDSAPRNLHEEQLTAIWCEVLGRHGVGIHTDFFQAGGDSLLAARTAALASGRGLRLTVGDILTHPTIAEQARILADREHTGSGGPDAALPVAVPDAAGRFEPFALTDLQQAYLLGRGGFFALGDVPAAFYAEIEADKLDVSALEAAWGAVVARHGMLRTVFTDDGQQRELEKVPAYRFAIHDLRAVGEEERCERLEAVRAEVSGRVREPGTWPLFEVAVSKVEGERCILHVAIDLLIADGATLGRIVHEWSTYYREPEADVPLPEVSFRDYVRALEKVEDSTVHATARDYWLKRLPELPPAPELPLRVPAESVTSARFSPRSFTLEPGQWARLRQQALKHGLTPSMVLCWAYAATLRTWSASDAFTLNVTVNDRLPVHPDIDRVVGEFTSVVLLAAEMDPTAPVRDQAQALQERFWEGFAHRAFSGVQVLRELARTDSDAPTTMPVVFTSALGAGETSLGQAATAVGELTYTITQTPQVYLDCQVFELGGGLRVQWAVVEELFPDGLVDAAFGAFVRLVECLADDEQMLDSAALGLVPAADLVARGEANATTAAVPQGLLHELGGFLAERGDAPAVIAAGRTLSYGECDRLASRVGRRLRELGACRNSLVGVVMDKGWEQPVAALGVLYSGAAYLPVDAGWPEERVRRILERGGCRIVLTQSHLVEKTEWPEGVTVLAVDDPQVWAGVDESPLEAVAGVEDLAYVIFTSGSTGEPKGVMIDHRGAANTVADINDRFGVGACDRVLGLSSLSFDLSVWDIFGMFAAGGAVVLPGPDAHRDPAVWLGAVREHGVSVWNSVPALMEMFTDYVAAGGETADGLRLVLLSGDWIPLSLPGRIRETAPNAGVVSLGGATEASIWSIHYPIGEVDPGWRSIPYGRPLANQSFAVLDARLEPAPIWVPGELFIGGVGVACGYWGDAGRTAERFIDHPVSGERLYRTGDLGRYLPDGSIEFLGRNDHQVKINGYRIELGEIEAHLNAHPAVKDVVVTATHNQLTAYLTPNSESSSASHSSDDPDSLTASLRDHLATALPDYMVPRAFVMLDALPLTTNGKIDRSALPAPHPTASTAAGHVSEDGGDSPRNDIERRLKDIWTEVLPTDTVGIHDIFGEVGGDSLLALRIISKSAEAGLALTPRQFFENPTIAGLARVATLAAPRTSAVPADVTGPAPLLPAQAMLLSGLSEEAAQHHNYALFFELAEPMDKVALRVALRTVIARHDALRTGFVLQREGRQQEVRPAKELPTAPLEWLDLAGLPAEDQDRTIEERAEQAQRSFDLADPPLLRVLYFERGKNHRPELLLIAHWLVVDNFSLRLVLDELLTAHDHIVEVGEAELPPVSLPAADWARRLAGYGSRPEALTAVAAREPVGSAGEAATLIDIVGSATVDRLRADTQGPATMGDVLLAALARAARTCGFGDAIDVEVDGHGRAAALPDVAVDLSRTVGRLSVRYPLRVSAVDDGCTGTEAVVAARSAQPNGGLDHALATYGTTAHVNGGAGGADFAFNYLGAVDELYAHPRLAPSAHRPGPLLHPGTPLRHRFEFLCGTVDGALLIGITSAGAERTAAARLLNSFVSELGATAGSEPPAGHPADSRGTALAESFRHWLSAGTVA